MPPDFSCNLSGFLGIFPRSMRYHRTAESRTANQAVGENAERILPRLDREPKWCWGSTRVTPSGLGILFPPLRGTERENEQHQSSECSSASVHDHSTRGDSTPKGVWQLARQHHHVSGGSGQRLLGSCRLLGVAGGIESLPGRDLRQPHGSNSCMKGIITMDMQEQLSLPLTSELWRPVPGYEGFYEVSDQGNVRSVTRIIRGKPNWGTRIMESQLMSKSLTGKRYKVSGQGYLCVRLCQNGKGTLFHVARLVASAFIPNPTNLPQVDHVDGNPRNDVVRNLNWVTNQENQIRAVKNGQHKPVRGEKQPTHILTREQVLAIRMSGKYQRAIAKEFGISKTQVARIQHREAWGWL